MFRNNPDEGLRRLERDARLGDERSHARLLRRELQKNMVQLRNVRLAAYLGYVPAKLAIGWSDPEDPFISIDSVFVLLSSNGEWGHRMAALWAFACVDSTRWIWDELNERPGGAPGASQAPGNALKLVHGFLGAGTPCPGAEDYARSLQIRGFMGRFSDVVRELDRISFGARRRARSGNRGPENTDLCLMAEAAAQWVKALSDTLSIFGPNTHSSSNSRLWGNRHTIGSLWQPTPARELGSSPPRRFADLAREAYRATVWAVDYYGGGDNRPGPVMDKAQLDVDHWVRAAMIPEVLA